MLCYCPNIVAAKWCLGACYFLLFFVSISKELGLETEVKGSVKLHNKDENVVLPLRFHVTGGGEELLELAVTRDGKHCVL